jgi:hypothetical protein
VVDDKYFARGILGAGSAGTVWFRRDRRVQFCRDYNCQSPNHAVDNAGNTDFILLTFNQTIFTATLTLNDAWSAPTLRNTDTTYFVGNCIGGSASNGTVQVPCNPNGKTATGGSPDINTLNFSSPTYGLKPQMAP